MYKLCGTGSPDVSGSELKKAFGVVQELIAAHQFKGAAVQKRESVHATAVANQAAAHFRWRSSGALPAGSVDMDRKSYRPVGRRIVKKLQGAFP